MLCLLINNYKLCTRTCCGAKQPFPNRLSLKKLGKAEFGPRTFASFAKAKPEAAFHLFPLRTHTMAKEKPTDPDKDAKRAAKTAKKEAKRSETDGVHKSKSVKPDKKEKKDKKDKKEKKEKKVKEAEAADVEVTTKLLNALEETKPGSVVVKEKEGDLEVKVKSAPLQGALVPFANPLADEKVGKKVLKSVKKGIYSPPWPIRSMKEPMANKGNATAAKNKSLKRGVKEVVKSLRKSPAASGVEAPAIVVLAADISPMDVISHLPVLCEDHGVPYIFVTSRAELGAASSTKRPTSVVMVSREAGGKKKVEKEEGAEDFGEVYNDLVKLVLKAGRDVRI